MTGDPVEKRKHDWNLNLTVVKGRFLDTCNVFLDCVSCWERETLVCVLLRSCRVQATAPEHGDLSTELMQYMAQDKQKNFL